MGGGKPNSFYVKKLLLSLILICCAFAVFAQNVKPYVVDLSKMPAVNDDKTAAFDKATKTVTINKRDASIYLWLADMDISDYNIIRIKYKVLDDYGFIFTPNYNDDSIEWDYKSTYCPSYLTEMVIPILPKQKKLNGINFCGAWNVLHERIILESVSFEKVTNPIKTDVYACDDLPVIDTAAGGKFDDKISAWDYVKELGVGFQYFPFIAHQLNTPLDFGTDVYTVWSFSKPSKEVIHFIKEKGFKTLRLQTAPEFFLLDGNYTISPRYIKELKQVVDWAIEEDMYVIICGLYSEWLKKDEIFRKKVEEEARYAGVTVSENYKKQSAALIKAVWKQYAEAFNNSYDEHLIFETLNEPIDAFQHEQDHDGFHPKEDCAICKKDFAILNEYNQLIVDTVRATGGNNAKRFIMVEGLGSRWWTTTTKLFKMPKDKTEDRLIPCVHIYPMDCYPWQKDIYTDGVRQSIKEAFAELDKTYFSKHIPVYISEMGHTHFTPIMERINCIKEFMMEVTKSGRSCAVTMHATPQPSDFDYYNSWTLEWKDTEYIDTILYAAQGKDFKLSDEFIKKNEIKPESIVGKNLLKEPVEKKNWGMSFELKSDIFYRSTPAKYNIEFEIEKTGNNPVLDFAYMDLKQNWHNASNTQLLKKMRVKGGTIQDSITVKAKKVILTIDEDLAREIAENSFGVYLNGQDIIIKSMKVVN